MSRETIEKQSYYNSRYLQTSADGAPLTSRVGTLPRHRSRRETSAVRVSPCHNHTGKFADGCSIGFAALMCPGVAGRIMAPRNLRTLVQAVACYRWNTLSLYCEYWYIRNVLCISSNSLVSWTLFHNTSYELPITKVCVIFAGTPPVSPWARQPPANKLNC